MKLEVPGLNESMLKLLTKNPHITQDGECGFQLGTSQATN